MMHQNSHTCSEMAEAFFQDLYKYDLIWLYELLGGVSAMKIFGRWLIQMYILITVKLKKITWYTLLGEEVCKSQLRNHGALISNVF